MMRSMSAQLASQTAQLASMDAKMVKIDSIDNEVKSLKVLLNDLKAENKQLKQEAAVTESKLADMNERNNQLENRLNNLEQHHRGWSARVLNIRLTPEEESDNTKVADAVYNRVLLPILQGARERKLLQHIPSVDQLLEVAHVLNGKPGEPKPVILRFFSRNIKDMIFKLKKFYAPRDSGGRSGGKDGGRNSTGGGGGTGGEQEEAGGFEGRGKYLFPLYEDLTRATFKKMRAISDDNRVKACWSIKGQLKFVQHKSPNEIRKVVSIFDPLDTILK
jgi:hypothetical protein